MITTQDVFDSVWNHFIRDKNPAAVDKPYGQDRNYCYYRTDDGRKCSVGVLIPDEVYNEFVEGCSVESLHGDEGWFRETYGHIDLAFLIELRECHDKASVIKGRRKNGFWKEMENYLRAAAEYWKLQIPGEN